MSQTGEGVELPPYWPTKESFKRCRLEHVPVISVNPSGIEKNPGFKYSFGLLHRSMMALAYGDLLLMSVL